MYFLHHRPISQRFKSLCVELLKSIQQMDSHRHAIVCSSPFYRRFYIANTFYYIIPIRFRLVWCLCTENEQNENENATRIGSRKNHELVKMDCENFQIGKFSRMQRNSMGIKIAINFDFDFICTLYVCRFQIHSFIAVCFD